MSLCDSHHFSGLAKPAGLRRPMQRKGWSGVEWMLDVGGALDGPGRSRKAFIARGPEFPDRALFGQSDDRRHQPGVERDIDAGTQDAIMAGSE